MVETYDPSDIQNLQPLTMTPQAIKHVVKELSKEAAIGIRLAAKKSGCSGYMYVVDYVKEAANDDQIFSFSQSVDLYVSVQDLPLLEGTEIDYVQKGLNWVFQFNNPHAQNTCGCGESFGV